MVFCRSSKLGKYLKRINGQGKFDSFFLGHPPARETSQDGQYESGVRERVNLTPIPGRPSGRPEVNHLTKLSIWAGFFLTTGRVIFGSETPLETINLGPGFRTSSIQGVFCKKKRSDDPGRFFKKRPDSNKKSPRSDPRRPDSMPV